MKKFIVLLLVIVVGNYAFSQDITQKVEAVQTFLDDADYGEIFKAKHAKYYDDTLVVWLDIDYSTNDSNYVAWNTLNEKFENEKNYSFSEYLFYSVSNVLRQEPNKLLVYIFDHIEINLFAVYIFFENDEIVIDEEIETKSGNSSLSMSFNNVSSRMMSVQKGKSLQNRQEVYEFITEWVKRFYGRDITSQNNSENNNLAQIRTFSTENDVLKFEIIGLRDMVVDSKSNWINMRISNINKMSNQNRKYTEYLKFEIKYLELVGNEFQLDCKIDGKYGFENDVNWHTMLNMEPELTYYLQNFTDEFMKQLNSAMRE